MTNSCGLFLITKDWKTLIGKSSRNGTHQMYSIPKGKAEFGEGFIDAAVRELWEESNVRIDTSKHVIHALDPIKYARKSKYLHPFYILGIDPIEFPNLKCNTFTDKGRPELTDLEWRSLSDCETLLHPTQAEAIRQIKEYLLTNNL